MANPKPSKRFTPEQAREAGRKGNAILRARLDLSLKDPDALADASLRRLLATGHLIERTTKDLEGRELLEGAKVLVAIDQTVLDRTRGKPRPTPEGQALPDDYAKAVREANKRAQALASSEHAIEISDADSDPQNANNA